MTTVNDEFEEGTNNMDITQYTPVDKNMRLEDFVKERIDNLCTFNCISKYRLAQMTGIAPSSFSTMMSGKTLPSLGTLDKLCSGLGISIFDFFNIDTGKVNYKSQEQMLLRHWHQLDERQKFAALAYIQGMLIMNNLGNKD